MARCKKNKDVSVETQTEFAKDVAVAEVSKKDELSGLVLEAPEVFLDNRVAVEVKDRTFNKILPTIRDDINEVSKSSSTHSMNNTELFRTMSAKMRARRFGKKVHRSGKIKANFNIG